MAVLHIQETCIRLCTTEHSLSDIYWKMLDVLGEQLIQLGVIKPMESRPQFIQVCYGSHMRAKQWESCHRGSYQVFELLFSQTKF